MPRTRLPMRKIRDVLRLTAAGMSSRTGGGEPRDRRDDRRRFPGTRPGCWCRLPDDVVDAALETQLYPASALLAEVKARRPLPDWAAIHRELKRPGVTLQLVREEHRGALRIPADTAVAVSANCFAPGKVA